VPSLPVEPVVSFISNGLRDIGRCGRPLVSCRLGVRVLVVLGVVSNVGVEAVAVTTSWNKIIVFFPISTVLCSGAVDECVDVESLCFSSCASGDIATES
jgi:hypothetical protein